MRIALCLIVKDELAFLADAVDSARGLADQVVIVDTGSTDGTVELARSLADVLLEVPFDGDFSAARNLALDAVDADWIVFLDADERLPQGSHPALREQFADAPDDVHGLRLLRYNFFANGTFYTGRELRAFRHHPRIRYRRRINESVGPAIAELGGRVAPAPILLNHFGHCRPVRVRDRKAERYQDLMCQQLRDQPDDALLVGYLGLIDRTLGAFESAMSHSAKAVDMDPESSALRMFRGHVLRSVGEDERALESYKYAASLSPDQPAAQNMIGVQLQVLGDLDGAVSAFEAARQLDPLLVHVDVNLGLVAQAREAWREAVERFERAALANAAFLEDRWEGRLECDPYRAFYTETVFGYAGLGYHLGYCRLRADGSF